MFAGILKFIFKDILLDIILFPVWWYTEGLRGVLNFLWMELRRAAGAIGIVIWLKSMFKPMYGERSWQGRLISFFMRIVVLIWKLVLFFGWTAILAAIFLVWILILPYVLWRLIIVFRP